MEKENKPHDFLREAFEETRVGNLKRAIEIYDDILSKNPNDSDALVNKSIALMNSKRYDESLVCLSTISHESPHGFDKMLVEASCLYSLGEDEKAQDLYTKISNVLPLNRDTVIQIGSKCLEQGFYRTSIEIFSKLEDKAHKFEKNYLLGLSYKGLGELTNAIRAFGRALRAKPDFYQLYAIAASTCFQNNMQEEGDKLMNILKDEHFAFFQNVAGITSCYRNKDVAN